MKKLTKSITLVVTLLASLSAHAGQTDNQNLTLCKASVQSELAGVEKVKLANLKSRRGEFQAKFRVVANGERSMVLCKLDKQQVVAISCVTGTACDASNVASSVVDK